jgi:NADPH-dependent curcumin reductase CurA
MRGRISEAKSYAEPVQIGQVMVGGTVGTAVQSEHPGFRSGEVVVGYWGWQEYAISDGQGVDAGNDGRKNDPPRSPKVS